MKTKSDENGCLIVMVMFTSVPFLMAWRGYMMKIMWGWFLVGLGAPQISVVQALGIVSLVTIIMPSTAASPKTEHEGTAVWPILGKALARGICEPAFFLLCSYILKSIA